MIYRSLILMFTLCLSTTAVAGTCKNPAASKSFSQLKRNSWCVLVKSAQKADLSYEQQQQLNSLTKKALPLLKEVKKQGLQILKDTNKILQKDEVDKAGLENLRKEAIEGIDTTSKEILDLGTDALDILDVQQRKIMLQSIRKHLSK